MEYGDEDYNVEDGYMGDWYHNNYTTEENDMDD